MKRIADLDITEELNALLALRDLAAAREPKPFLDSSSLTLAALADDMWTEAAGGFLSVKQLPDCGRCSNGFLSVDRGLSYIPPPALPCPHCEVPRRRFARVRYACLPLDAKGVSLSEYEWDSKVQADAILGAQKWLVGDRASTAPNILLHGKPGNGKTTLLYGLALSALDRGLKVRYTSQTRLFDAEKDSWKGDTDSPFKSWRRRPPPPRRARRARWSSAVDCLVEGALTRDARGDLRALARSQARAGDLHQPRAQAAPLHVRQPRRREPPRRDGARPDPHDRA